MGTTLHLNTEIKAAKTTRKDRENREKKKLRNPRFSYCELCTFIVSIFQALCVCDKSPISRSFDSSFFRYILFVQTFDFFLNTLLCYDYGCCCFCQSSFFRLLQV